MLIASTKINSNVNNKIVSSAGGIGLFNFFPVKNSGWLLRW